MVPQSPIRKQTATGHSSIPDKLYFRIGEVARLCDVPAYVLRFWEGEFPQLHPNKGGSGQRLFRRRDVEMALRIRSLLYDEGYTISGARQLLRTEPRSPGPQLAIALEPPCTPRLEQIERLRLSLEDLLAVVSKPRPEAKSATSRRPRPFASVEHQSERLFEFGVREVEREKEADHE